MTVPPTSSSPGPSDAPEPAVLGVDPPIKEPADLSDLIGALENRNSLVVRLAESVDALASQVTKLRRDLDDRPTKTSVAHRRRRAFVAMMLIVIGLTFVQDQNNQVCGPGAQSAAILDFIVNRPVPEPGEPRPPLVKSTTDAVIDDSTPTAACDVAFPLHRHGISTDKPLITVGDHGVSGWNLLGFGLYGLLGVILYLFQRGPGKDPEQLHTSRKA